MRIKPVVAERDAETAGGEEEEEHADLKPIDTKGPEIGRDCGDREEKGADEERTGNPVHFVEGNAREHEGLYF